MAAGGDGDGSDGGSNNIAKTLGVVGEAHELVAALGSAGARRPFDFGAVSGSVGCKSRRERFIEALGGGPDPSDRRLELALIGAGIIVVCANTSSHACARQARRSPRCGSFRQRR